VCPIIWITSAGVSSSFVVCLSSLLIGLGLV
jgi:hypothetical protein